MSRTLQVLAIVIGAAIFTFVFLSAGILPSRLNSVERAVAAKLRDPESALFRDIVGTDDMVCGEVNARNALGGYTGFQPFVYRRGMVLFEPRPSVGTDVKQQAQYHEDVTRFVRWQSVCSR